MSLYFIPGMLYGMICQIISAELVGVWGYTYCNR